ncbi:hypothetical protein CGH85_23295 [Vibrio parahaemolyticus]|uniref:hypothetical protein n=1 Tax=Vibrio parahaemolyticus TaxID=670 RepID=UPI00111DD29B|nr:hypothetical protein [Vibrio parahaemolyticus]TOM02820.1 hypothetical protein CGH85_23295 [Vibrio parahaemolyticus]
MERIQANFEAALYAVEILIPITVFCLVLVVAVSFGYRAYTTFDFFQSTLIFSVFSAFGTTIGMFMGASKSEIVSSLLPPLITLVSGYLAYIGSKDFSDNIKCSIPGGVLVLLISLLYAAFYMKSWYMFTPT